LSGVGEASGHGFAEGEERASRRSEVARWATECKRKAYLLHCIYKKCKPCGIRKAIIQQGKQRSEFLHVTM